MLLLLLLLLTHSKLLVRSYSNITNRSNGLIKLSTDSGVVTKEQSAGVITGFPCVPCSSFTSSSTKRQRIVTCKSMEHWQCHTPIRPQSSCYLMSCYKTKAFSGSKSNPYFSVVKALRWCHCQYYRISVNFRISLPVPASSCVHGASPAKSPDWLQNTSVRYVLIVYFLQSMDTTTVVARKENSSTLFSSMRKILPISQALRWKALHIS